MPADNEMPERVARRIDAARGNHSVNVLLADADTTIRWLAEALDRAQRERDALRTAISRSARVIDPLSDGECVRWVGVYVLDWNGRESPTIGFTEWGDDEIDALIQASEPSDYKAPPV